MTGADAGRYQLVLLRHGQSEWNAANLFTGWVNAAGCCPTWSTPRPLTESLSDVTARLLPYWYDAIIPDLRTGACVLVVSHGNTLRALIRHLERMSEEDVVTLNVATASPLAYELDRDLRPVTRPEQADLGSAAFAPRASAPP